MANICIPKEFINDVKAIFDNPSSVERTILLKNKFGDEVGNGISLKYERALTSKHYEKVLASDNPENALNKLFKELTITPEKRLEMRANFEANVLRKKGIIDEKELAAIIKNAVDGKYKLKITPQESLEMLRLNKSIKKAKIGSREWGEAQFNQQEYLSKLEDPTIDFSLKDKMKYNWNETKQGWKDLEGAGFFKKAGYAANKIGSAVFSEAYKSFKATLDASFIGIQGSTIAARSPANFMRSLNASSKAFGKNAMKEFRINQLADPEYEGMVLDGVRFPTREEQMMTSWVEKIGLGVGRSIKATNDAFSMFLQTARKGEYVRFRNSVEANLKRKLDRTDSNFAELLAKDPHAVRDSQILKEIADHANKVTGTTNLGALEKHAQLLNKGLFAGRYTVSGIRMITDIFDPSLSVAARKEAVKTLGLNTTALYGTYATLAALYPDNTDLRPNSANFMKIKLNNGVWVGVKPVDQWIVQLTSKLIAGEEISTKGNTIKYGEGYKPVTRGDAILRVLRSKLAPVPAVLTDVAVGKDFLGKPATLGREIKNLTAPIYPTSVIEQALSDNDISTQLTVDFLNALGTNSYTR